MCRARALTVHIVHIVRCGAILPPALLNDLCRPCRGTLADVRSQRHVRRATRARQKALEAPCNIKQPNLWAKAPEILTLCVVEGRLAEDPAAYCVLHLRIVQGTVWKRGSR